MSEKKKAKKYTSGIIDQLLSTWNPRKFWQRRKFVPRGK
jgi:hypothetical protein